MKNRYLIFFVVILMLIIVSQVIAQEFETGTFAVSVNDYGRMRAYTPNLAGLRQIERSSILVGASPSAVFDYYNDADTEIAPHNVASPFYSDFEVFGSFNNAWSMAPPNVLAEEDFFGWTGGTYALVKFNVINREHSSIDAVIGLEIIPYIDYVYGNEVAEYLSESMSISMHRGNSFIGYRFLSPELTSLAIFEWYDGYNESDEDLWNWLTQGTIDEYYQAGADGSVVIPGIEAIILAENESAEVYFAIAYGTNETEMLDNLDLAEEQYLNLFVSVEEQPIIQPQSFRLYQNYPNPFNPVTKISFSLEKSVEVALSISNTSGQEVTTLIDQTMNKGYHEVTFDASSFTSGLYFYTLSVNGTKTTKKMLLLK